MSSPSSRIIPLVVALGFALIAFGGVSLAATAGDSQAQTAPEGGGSDSPGQSDNPSDDTPNKGEFPSGNPSPDTTPSGNSGGLPFTGYLAIPLLLLGVAMLGTSFVLRRRAV